MVIALLSRFPNSTNVTIIIELWFWYNIIGSVAIPYSLKFSRVKISKISRIFV